MRGLLRIFVIMMSAVMVYRYRYQLLNAILGVNLIRRLVEASRITLPQIRKRLLVQ